MGEIDGDGESQGNDGNTTKGGAEKEMHSQQQRPSTVELGDMKKGEESTAGESTDNNGKGSDTKEKENKKRREYKMPEVSPEYAANMFSRLTFWWLRRLLWQGYMQPLDQKDLWPVVPTDTAGHIAKRYARTTEKEEPTIDGKIRPLWHSMAVTFKKELIIAAVIKLVITLMQLLPPLLLNSILLYMEKGTDGKERKRNFMYKIFGEKFGYYAAVALFVVPVVRSLLENQFFVMMFRLGMKIRVVLVNLLYNKTLRLSTGARQAKSVGETVTLMQVDAVKVSDAAPFIHTAWSSILEIGLYVILLIVFLGWSAIVGVVFLIISMPLQARIIRRLLGLQQEVMVNTGERVKVINEVLQGMRVVKTYAWERPFQTSVEGIRKRELRAMLKRALLRAYLNCVMLATPVFIMVLTFAFYSQVQKAKLTPATVFTGLSLFTALRMPLIFYPFVMNSLVGAYVSIRRLTAFMNLEDAKPIERTRDYGAGDGKVVEDIVAEGDFRWSTLPPAPAMKKSKSEKKLAKDSTGNGKSSDSIGKNNKPGGKEVKVNINARVTTIKGSKGGGKDEEAVPFGLEGISLRLQRGQMIAVVGPVGSGKSSLASALLGDMDQKKGPTICIRGSVAYCGQQAWIMNATMRDNILFGRDFDETSYDAVIQACALNQDFEALPSGDLTEIGERGINLSGGQKQRVSLARAVYSDADIYVLDDPLSAVDAHVGAHLFSRCINGLLADKSRIFITNQLQYVPDADHIIVLKEGRVVQQGTYKELMKSGGDFSQLMKDSGSDKVVATAKVPAAAEGGNTTFGDSLKTRILSNTNLQGAETAAKSADPKQSDESRIAKGALVAAETKEAGTLKFHIYKTYWTETSRLAPIFLCALFVVSQSVEVFSTFWLAFWTKDEFNQSVGFYLGIYAALGAGFAILLFCRSFTLMAQSLWTSKILHAGLLDSVLHASMSFFDTTPIGRILNRFSNDISMADEMLAMSWNMTLIALFSALGSFVAIAQVTPFFILILLPVGVLYGFVQQIYRRTGRELKRLDSVTKSPLYQQFSETLSGLSTIRAYQREKEFADMNNEKIDVNTKAFMLLKNCDRWLSLCLEVLGGLLVAAAAILAVSNDKLYAGYAGVSIQYSLNIVMVFGLLMRSLTDTENQMNSVERILEYRDTIKPEAPHVIDANKPPANWPTKGAIDFQNITMRYRAGLPLVLKNVSLSVAGGEKVGVVGRTGSGKSSLMLCLFRLVEPEAGQIIIDGVQTAKIGLEDLRSRLSIIPQDPVLFSGTIRKNLDPFQVYGDDVIWEVLGQAHLKEKIGALPQKLESNVTEYGENFSVGERQLICLARVLLRKSKILVMDEATSSVDFETDQLIQATIRLHLGDTTMLVIAHRIHTVIDANQVLVLADGEVSEYGTPANLLEDPDSKFTALVKSTGEHSFDRLVKIARGELDFFASYSQSVA